ncbi:MAG: TadE/TadG family type IV pilus assembly protein [Candidatus Dormiibacterota bacterium]
MLSFRNRRLGQGRRAQATVEFAVIAPIFFVIFFGIINGGLLLYSRNAVQHAADVGAAQLAAQGSASGADQAAFTVMDQETGLDSVLLTKVTGVTIREEDPVTTTAGETLTPDTTGCGANGEGSGYPCEMQYTEASGVWSCTGTCNWPSVDRQTSQTTGLTGYPNFAELVISYTYNTVGGLASFKLTATDVFRLEPQSL